MKLANKIIEGTKPLDKALKDIEKKMAGDAEAKKIEDQKRLKILGKENKNKSPLDMTDAELKAIFSPEKVKKLMPTVKRVRAKRELDKKRANSKPAKNQKGKETPLEDQIFGGALGRSGAKKSEIKPGVFQFDNPSGKFKMKATVDLNKKTVTFKGHSDDFLFVKSAAERRGFKFNSK